MGRETQEKRSDGSETTTTLSRAKINGLWRMSQRVVTTGGADDGTIFDSLARPIESLTFVPTPTGQQPQRQKQIAQYDRLNGKLKKQSVLAAGDTPDAELKWDEYVYDSVGREIRHASPWNAITTTAYDGLTIDSTDALLQQTSAETDALGRPVVITDAAKGKTRYCIPLRIPVAP